MPNQIHRSTTSRPSRAGRILLAAGLLAAAAALPAQELPPSAPPSKAPAPAAPPADAPAASQIDTEKLLANPIQNRPEFKKLYARRRELAVGPMAPADFERAADDVAALGAYFSAVELLWFADIMTDDAAKHEAYQARMKGWIKDADPANKIVEEGEQLFAAGKIQESLDRYKAALEQNQFCEKAHYAAANANFLIHLRETADEKKELPPLADRARLFRLMYERLSCAIAIDPLLYDAHYLLATAREVIPDDGPFLEETQVLTDRAVKFRGEVLPALEQIESGQRAPEIIHMFGEALEAVGIPDYAIFAYHAAQVRGSKAPATEELKKALVEKLKGPKK